MITQTKVLSRPPWLLESGWRRVEIGLGIPSRTAHSHALLLTPEIVILGASLFRWHW